MVDVIIVHFCGHLGWDHVRSKIIKNIDWRAQAVISGFFSPKNNERIISATLFSKSYFEGMNNQSLRYWQLNNKINQIKLSSHQQCLTNLPILPKVRRVSNRFSKE